MKTLFRVLHTRLGREPLDASLSQWGCILGGICLCSMAVPVLRKHAATEIEMLVGQLSAVGACLLLFLLGVLARQVHLKAGKAPWHLRRWELIAHGVGLAVLGLAAWRFADLSMGIAGVVTFALLTLQIYAAILCLGCWSTLCPLLGNRDEPGAMHEPSGSLR